MISVKDNKSYLGTNKNNITDIKGKKNASNKKNNIGYKKHLFM